jgi:two-component system OmpR family sensor kinase
MRSRAADTGGPEDTLTSPGTDVAAVVEGGLPAHRTSLALRITLLVVSVAVTMAIIAGVVGAAMIRNTAVDVTRTYLSNQANVLDQQLAGEDPGYRIGLAKLAQVFKQQGIAVVTENRSGRLDGADAQAVRQANGAGVATMVDGAVISRTVSVNGHTVLLEARSVNGRAFALVASANLGAGTQKALQRRVLLALVIGLLAAVIGGLVIARLVTRPLRRTADTARAMGAGSRQMRAPVAGPSEVADVAIAVNELADALQHSESRQREFLTSVSHELRTPLAAISGQAEALSDGIVPEAEVPQVGRTIRAESARLERLVFDLLDLARLGADSFRLELAPCDLTALIREMASVWQVRCDQRSVPLLVPLPPGPVVVVTDARRVRQVLDGLAENALRLLAPGAPLVLALSVGASARLEVRDGGPGLTAQDYPVAFEQGVLHDRYRGRRPGGAGLGLALVHSLVTRLGGTVTAGPAPEGGAGFLVELPLSPAQG